MSREPVIARRLREARERTGISQRELGIRAGIDEFSASPRINQYERGKHIPNPLVLERLATVLKVPVGYLYTRDDLLAELLLEVSGLSGQWQAPATEETPRWNSMSTALVP